MVGRNPNVTIDPDAEASSTTDTQTAAAVSKSQVRSPSSRGPTTRPFKPISPTLTKSLFRGTGDDESKQRPFGSGKDTTEDQRYRRFLEIKDEIRKRARKIEQAKARNAKIVKLPPLTGIESFCLFVNSWELHALVLVAFLNVAYFLDLGSAIAVACTVHTLFFLFWVSVWMHSRNSNSRRLEDYAELSRNVELAPLLSLAFYMTFAHFHRWRWWDIVISAIIVGSPPLLQRIAHGFARRIHPPPQAAPQSAEDMELQELEAALRKMRVKNQARRAKKTTIAIKKRRDDPPVRPSKSKTD